MKIKIVKQYFMTKEEYEDIPQEEIQKCIDHVLERRRKRGDPDEDVDFDEIKYAYMEVFRDKCDQISRDKCKDGMEMRDWWFEVE